MKIQRVNYKYTGSNKENNITYSTLNSPRAFDDFDINIIDLSNEDLWCFEGKNPGETNSSQDLDTIGHMVEISQKAIVFYVLPQNCIYHFHYDYSQYLNYEYLKDILIEIYSKTLLRVTSTDEHDFSLFYNATETLIGNIVYKSDFCFEESDDIAVVTRSLTSKQITTIKLSDRIYATTLNVTNDVNSLLNYINNVLFPHRKQDTPDWVRLITFGDDQKQKSLIDNAQQAIEQANKVINAATEKLGQNNHYKSILYTNGDELVSVIFEILEQLLEYDLSEFVDLKREDFLIKKPSCTFIGEIKGVTSNIKYEHISQLELHYRGYLDKLEEQGLEETVKQILIMNPFRTKPLEEREPVHTSQIELAHRNNCLIIETNTLLRVYERFVQGEITSQKCEEVFSAKTGLLALSDFESTEDLEPYKV